MDHSMDSLIGEERFELTIRGGRIVTDGRVIEGDLGVRDGRIAAIGGSLPPGLRDVDATGRWVLPGGIDSHCHVEQRSGMGMMCADDFYWPRCRPRSAAPPPSCPSRRSTAACRCPRCWPTTASARPRRR